MIKWTYDKKYEDMFTIGFLKRILDVLKEKDLIIRRNFPDEYLEECLKNIEENNP